VPRVAGFLDKHQEKFFSLVATDRRRASFVAYGVSGTPTMVLVGKDGVVAACRHSWLLSR